MANLKDYCEVGAIGTEGEGGDLKDKEIRGMPTSRKRMELRRQCEPEGPVGLLIESAHINAARIDHTGKMRQEGQPTVDILGEAYQDLKQILEKTCKGTEQLQGKVVGRNTLGILRRTFMRRKERSQKCPTTTRSSLM